MRFHAGTTKGLSFSNHTKHFIIRRSAISDNFPIATHTFMARPPAVPNEDMDLYHDVSRKLNLDAEASSEAASMLEKILALAIKPETQKKVSPV